MLDAHRGRGLGAWLIETVIAHPELAGQRLMLATADAQGLYERFGFVAVDPERVLERPA